MSMEARTFGEWLDDLLRERRLSQTDFALALGTSQSTVSAWVNGASRPTRRNVRAIADALGLERHDALIRAGYAVASADASSSTIALNEQLDTGWNQLANGQSLDDDARIYASMVESLQALDLSERDVDAVKRFIEFTVEQNRRRKSDSS